MSTKNQVNPLEEDLYHADKKGKDANNGTKTFSESALINKHFPLLKDTSSFCRASIRLTRKCLKFTLKQWKKYWLDSCVGLKSRFSSSWLTKYLRLGSIN